MDLLNKIRERLQNRVPSALNNMEQDLVHSAVLIPIFYADGKHRVVFTERTHKVEHHKGQISFPGGAVEKDDASFMETALRETFEEVGIDKNKVDILGQLDDQLTSVSGFIIHPFVGSIPYPCKFNINPDEVEKIIEIPLEVFMESNNEYRRESIDFGTFKYSGPVFIYKGVTIWGATAHIMDGFVNLIRSN